jgi:signal transduction histidine kinase
MIRERRGAPLLTPVARRRTRRSPWGRLPLGAKILLPIFAMTVATALGSAVFFTAQSLDLDRVTQAHEGRAIAIVVQGALGAAAQDPSSVGVLLRHVDLAYGNLAALCVLTVDSAAPRGTLAVYASGGPPSTCDPTSPLMPELGLGGASSRPRLTTAGQVEETAVAATIAGTGKSAVVEVQVRLTPIADLALPTLEKAAGAGLMLALFQTALVFGVLWISALRPLKELRQKASATARSARPSSADDGDLPNGSGDEIHDLSMRFEEMLEAVRDREAEILESHEKLETLISNSPVIVFSTDRDGVLLQIQGNEIDSIAKDVGRESLVGISMLQLVQHNAEFTAVVQRALAGEKIHEVVAVRNWMSETNSPEPVHLDVLMTPARDSDGRLSGITGLAVNVSDRVDAASARAESQHKSAFLASMSHELRTPLNSIMGFAQLLDVPASKVTLTTKQQRYVGHIYSSGEHLLALVSDLLDLAKVGAGQMQLNLEAVGVQAEVGDIVDKMRPLATEKGLTIGIDIPPELSSFTDRLRLRQILLNLLTNAVKFTPVEGGPILITGRSSGDGLEIAVADAGIGIALEEQASIFEEFTQVDRGASRRLDGTGLGLALTRRMAELVGGSIRVDSELGQGSTFTVWLPGLVPDSQSLQPAAAHAG